MLFLNKFAAKATLSYLEGTDWFATDYRNTFDGAITLQETEILIETMMG